MKKAFLYLIFPLLSAGTFAQASFEWAHICGHPFYGETKTRLATDNEGNVIMAGNFTDTAYFGNEHIISTGATDIFMAKYTASGNLMWLMRDGGTDYDYLQAIVSNDDGIYTAGSFYGSTFAGNNTFTSFGSQDIFIIRSDIDGKPLWARHLGSPKTDYINAADADAFGNLIITGHYYDSIAIADTVLYSMGGSDIFIAKYNPFGEMLWVQNLSGSSSDQSYALSCDTEGNILISGSFFYDITIGDTLLTTTDPTGVFFAMLNSEGETLFAIQADGSGLSAPSFVSFDATGNIYFAGNFTEVINFGPYSFDAGAFNVDIFITRYTSEGDLLWADHGHGAGSDQMIAVSVGPLNDLYLAGHFLDTIHFGELSLDYTLCCGSAEIFIVRYTENGYPVWGDQISGVSAMAESMIKNSNDELFISGMFREELTFGDTVLNTGQDNRNFLSGVDTETMTFIPEGKYKHDIKIYPNPAKDYIRIETIEENDSYTLRLFNLQGSILIQKAVHGSSSMDISHLSSGIYFLTVFDGQQEKLSSEILIKE